jgi:hypothetical protein
MQKKVVIPGKVDKLSNRQFKIKKDKTSERDTEIEIGEDGTYEVEKLSVDGLPVKMTDGTSIRWFNNFAIKKNGQYIKQKFKVKISGLSTMGGSRIVIYKGSGDPYYYAGSVTNDTIELSDGDPAVGGAP